MDEEAISKAITTSKAIKNDEKFEKVLVEYKKVIRQLKLKCIEKYGIQAKDWFGM